MEVDTAGATDNQSGLVGGSRAFLDVLAKIRAFSACDAPILIEGETGTGKELVARAVHYLSKRRGGPFAPINCAALPEHLVVNELFGHTRGAFTGAEARQAGLVEQACRGTIFFDEVDTLPLPAQAVLLRFLQDQEYRPLGGGAPKTGNVRVLAASNTSIQAKVRDRSFREDLFYRLSVLTLHLPPLRERRDDIPALAGHFLDRFRHRYGGPGKLLSAEAMAALGRHDWPGNVRELENRLHRAFVLAATAEINRADLELVPVNGHPWPQCAKTGNECMAFSVAKAQAVAEFEHAYLLRLMTATKGNVSAASRIASKERRTLARLLKKHGIDRRQFEANGR
jgi:DNA-binding NtrC family response regulator